jgi:hypothetical protein
MKLVKSSGNIPFILYNSFEFHSISIMSSNSKGLMFPDNYLWYKLDDTYINAESIWKDSSIKKESILFGYSKIYPDINFYVLRVSMDFSNPYIIMDPKYSKLLTNGNNSPAHYIDKLYDIVELADPLDELGRYYKYNYKEIVDNHLVIDFSTNLSGYLLLYNKDHTFQYDEFNNKSKFLSYDQKLYKYDHEYYLYTKLLNFQYNTYLSIDINLKSGEIINPPDMLLNTTKIIDIYLDNSQYNTYLWDAIRDALPFTFPGFTINIFIYPMGDIRYDSNIIYICNTSGHYCDHSLLESIITQNEIDENLRPTIQTYLPGDSYLYTHYMTIDQSGKIVTPNNNKEKFVPEQIYNNKVIDINSYPYDFTITLVSPKYSSEYNITIENDRQVDIPIIKTEDTIQLLCPIVYEVPF